MKIKYFVSLIIISLMIFFISSCSKSSSSSTMVGNDSTINISGMAFPSLSTVTKGTTVTWTNKDSFAHTVTSDDGTSFNSGNLAAGASFSFKTTTSGSFAYHCNIHSNMHGTLVVNP